MTRYAYIDCVSGVAGDMLLAALVDAGADPDRLRTLPRRLGLEGVSVDVTRVRRKSIAAVHVTIDAPPQPAGRSWAEMQSLFASSVVPPRALDVFRRLAAAEATVHGVAQDDIEFHELGSADTVVDICGTVDLLESLGVERLVCSPIPIGRGLISAASGLLPNPGPATLELLRGARLYGTSDESELVTPTGAALVATLAESFGAAPPMSLDNIGYGAGSRDLHDRPNVVRVLIGEGADSHELGSAVELVVLETNLDDMNPELVPDAFDRCFAAGALDVWTTAAQMKKGRPGLVFAALAPPDAEDRVAQAMLEETSSLGVRSSGVTRYALERKERVVGLGYGSVRVKLGFLHGRIVNIAPEHDDCALLARETGLSVKSVWAAALAAVQHP